MSCNYGHIAFSCTGAFKCASCPYKSAQNSSSRAKQARKSSLPTGKQASNGWSSIVGGGLAIIFILAALSSGEDQPNSPSYQSNGPSNQPSNGGQDFGQSRNKNPAYSKIKKNSVVTESYSNGTYEGELLHGKRHGYGIYAWKNGNRYDGQWEDGKYAGKGEMIWAGGDRYEGGYVDDKKQGYGVYTWNDGSRYVGQWLNNNQHGHGLKTWKNGNRYEGDFVQDKHTGKGVFTWADGTKYEGDFVDGKKHGYGVYAWVNGNRYEGQWLNGERTGQGKHISSNYSYKDGVYRYRSGSVYEGGYLNGERHGSGTHTFQSGGTCSGVSENGKWLDGYLYKWPDGQPLYVPGPGYKGDVPKVDGKNNVSLSGRSYADNVFLFPGQSRNGIAILQYGKTSATTCDDIYYIEYVGQLKSINKRKQVKYPNGNGVTIEQDGTKYEGKWETDELHTNLNGNVTWPNGTRYEGEWRMGEKEIIFNGYPHGEGRFVHKDGAVTKGSWTNGCFNETVLDGFMTWIKDERCYLGLNGSSVKCEEDINRATYNKEGVLVLRGLQCTPL